MKLSTLLTGGTEAPMAERFCYRIALLLGLAGALLVLAVGAATLPATLGAIGLVAGSLAAGRMLAHRNRGALDAIRAQADSELDRLARLYTACLPVWVRQLETVRSEADTEVAQLTRLFAGITSKLDRALGPNHLAHSTGAGTNEEILAALARNGRELESLVAALHRLQTSKQRIVEEIGAQASRLRDNASDIRRIALHTRTVSLNATIEAARAGQAGKPFAVIINDMRELANRTAEASEQFSRHAERLHMMVGAAFQEQAQTDDHVISIAGAEELVNEVVARSEATMRQLTREIAAMAAERKDVRQDISQVLVSLQFQDRVSQILSHVTSNLEEMESRLRRSDGAMDTRQWLMRMARDYSTHEEFENHSGGRSPATPAGAMVTYF